MSWSPLHPAPSPKPPPKHSPTSKRPRLIPKVHDITHHNSHPTPQNKRTLIIEIFSQALQYIPVT